MSTRMSPATRRRRTGRAAVAALLAATLLLAACGEDTGDDGDEGTSTSSTTETTTTSSSETSEPAEDVRPVGVYFVRGEKVAVARGGAEAPELARGALEALLAGPGEGAADMTSAVPAGSELLGLTIEDGVATADLSSEFASGGGSLSMQLRAAQVVFTLTQFDTVESVTLTIDGAEVDGLGGEGIPVTDVDRADFTGVTPLVLVTSPLPGEDANGSLRAEGISNTFEANVLYEVQGPEGEVLDSGFTTATAGTGTWGEFSFEASWDAGASGTGVLVVYQEDMESGGRQDVYEVPIRLGG